MCSIGLVLFIFFSPLFPKVNTNKPTSYAGFRVYEVIVDEKNACRMSYPEHGVSILSEDRIYSEERPYFVCSYLVPGHHEESFRRALRAVDAVYYIAISDLGKLIQEEKDSIAKKRSSGVGFNSKIYLSYAEMVEYLAYISQITNPSNGEPLAVMENIGRTYEGRDTFGVRISSGHRHRKPIILFEAGAHAREWTAPAAALYMIHQLVANYTHNKNVLRDIDFYIIPLSNPDGYEYSRIKDRLWRKTRSMHESGVYGVDVNRNFDHHWGETGASSNPSSDVYKGPYAFSEPETRNIRDVGKKYKSRLKAFVSIHAYGPYILYPWGYTRMIEAPDAPLMREVAHKASEEMRKFSGINYDIGQSSVLLYESAGGSDDYFKAVFKVPLAYTVELSSRGTRSFIVSPEKVPDIVAEAYEGFKVVAQCAADNKMKQEQGNSFVWK